MRYFNEEELGKYEWIGVGGEELYIFRGKVQDDLSMVEKEIDLILTNENIKIKNKKPTLGPKIGALTKFVEEEMNVGIVLKDFPDIFTKLEDLVKIRNFAAHGNCFVNSEKGFPTIIINNDEGLIFDTQLIKEYEELYWFCHKFILQLQSELGCYDDELEEFENQLK